MPTWVTDWSTEDPSAFGPGTTISLLRRLTSFESICPKKAPMFRREGNTLVVKGFVFDELGEMSGLEPYERGNNAALLRWRNNIPNDPVRNFFLFGEEQPTLSTLEQLYYDTYKKDQFTSNVWRDGLQAKLRVREDQYQRCRRAFLTKRGCLAFMYPRVIDEQRPKVCYLIGGRGLFVLVPLRFSPDGKTQFSA